DPLGPDIRPRGIVELCRHVWPVFRHEGNRESRARARLKFLLADWGAEAFRAELEKRLGRRLTDGGAPAVPVTANRAHIGIHAQKQPGLYYAGVATKRGRLPGTEM